MFQLNAKLLVVDDETPIRMSLSSIFTELGYGVRTAHDGFSALAEIRREIPDLILSDLKMPGMSGFELLSIVRCRFPAIQVIAMSGAFSGDGVPPGVAADAFYEKASHPGVLFRMVEAMIRTEMSPSDRTSALAPIWIPRNGHDHAGRPYVMVTCTECLRTFAQVLSKDFGVMQGTDCVYCSSPIHYAMVHPERPALPLTFQRKPASGGPTPLSVPSLSY